MSYWGRELLFPDEVAAENGTLCWLCRETVPDCDEALRIVVASVDYPRRYEADEVELIEVLMREESEVEAKINGHECQYMVECTKRARSPEPFWRVERRAA